MRWIREKFIHHRKEVSDVAVFLSENIGKVVGSANVLDVDKIICNTLTYSILSHLDMTKTFGSHIMGPLNASGVIVKNRNGAVNECRCELEVRKNV